MSMFGTHLYSVLVDRVTKSNHILNNPSMSKDQHAPFRVIMDGCKGRRVGPLFGVSVTPNNLKRLLILASSFFEWTEKN